MAYSQDLRQRIMLFILQGGGRTEASKRYAISERTVYRWLSQPVDYQPQKPGPRTNRKFDREKLIAIVQAQPDLMLKEIAAQLGVKVNTVSRTLINLGFTRKKNTAIRPSVHPPSDH